MKISKRQLRRIIREYGRSEHDAEARGMAASYQRGYSDGQETPQSPPTTGRDPEYLRGYEQGREDGQRRDRVNASDFAELLRGKNRMHEAISSTPTGKVEVEWDFQLDDDDDWNAMSYEDQEAEADLPPVIRIPDDVMSEYQADAAEYGDSQAEQVITDWLSDDTGWLHQGWSWV